MHPSWIDSHCHLQSLSDPQGGIERARDAGVSAMVCVGTDLETSRQAVELAGAPGIVGIGETGFDFHYTHSPADAQEAAFRAQIGLAKQLDRALVVHSRDAWDDTFGVLADEGAPACTVLHCFTGGPGEARRALDLGAFLSYSGIVTFPNADDVRAAAVITPADRLLVET